MYTDYILISVLFVLGTAFHVMQKVMTFRKNFPTLGFGQIWGTFIKNEWDSLLISLLILITIDIFLFIKIYNQWVFPAWLENWGVYLIALVVGYSGQRIAYKYLGTAEKILEKRVDSMDKI